MCVHASKSLTFILYIIFIITIRRRGIPSFLINFHIHKAWFVSNILFKEHIFKGFIHKFYDKNGKLEERKVDIPNGTSLKFEASKEFKEFTDYEKPQYIWCSIESEKHGLNFFACTYNTQTKHCSGDHGF